VTTDHHDHEHHAHGNEHHARGDEQYARGHGHHHHDHGHGRSHGAHGRLLHRLRHVVTPHSHDSADKVDSVLESSQEGMRALWISLIALLVTAALQAAVVAVSGSVALLGDTLHNAADALTAVPLGVAFILGRRTATRRYTYGFGRAEDIAGVFIVLTIAASSAAAAYEAIQRLIHPQPVTNLPIVAAAALIGFAGNELVARYRIRVGGRIGSAALVADGLHARTDGFTSLAVLLAAGGVAIGWGWVDSLVGLAITAAIALVLKDAAREVYRRLMDAVDPALVDAAETTLRATDGVRDVRGVRLRWIGHRLHAEAELRVDPALSLHDASHIAVDAEHGLLHAVPRLASALLRTDPAPSGAHDPRAVLAHHYSPEE
jgi:cation diffusion facilitator family transporter